MHATGCGLTFAQGRYDFELRGKVTLPFSNKTFISSLQYLSWKKRGKNELRILLNRRADMGVGRVVSANKVLVYCTIDV